MTGSEGTIEAVGVSSSAPVVTEEAVAAERSPPICEGKLWNAYAFSKLRLIHLISSPSVTGI